MAACGGRALSLIRDEGRSSTVWEATAENGMRRVPGLPELGRAVFTQVSRGVMHAAAVTSEGTLFLWGRRKYTVHRPEAEPVATIAGRGIRMAACARMCTLVLTESGEVGTCGVVPRMVQGEEDPPSDTYTVQLQTKLRWLDRAAFGGDKIEMVAAGTLHMVAVAGSGRVFTWGRNLHGCLGHDDGAHRARPSALAPAAFGAEPVGVVCAFESGTMAVTRSGVLYACGNNACNVLGLGADAGVDVLVPTRVGGADVFGAGVLCVSGSGDHTLAVTRGGRLLVCGRSTHGVLGLGPGVEAAEAFTLIDPTRFQRLYIVAASAGGTISAALSEIGSLFAWGCGAYALHAAAPQRRRCRRVHSLPSLHHHFPYGNYHELLMPEVVALLMGTHKRLGAAAGTPRRSSPRFAARASELAAHDSVLLHIPPEIMQALVRACARWCPTSDAVEVLMGGGLRRP